MGKIIKKKENEITIQDMFVPCNKIEMNNTQYVRVNMNMGLLNHMCDNLTIEENSNMSHRGVANELFGDVVVDSIRALIQSYTPSQVQSMHSDLIIRLSDLKNDGILSVPMFAMLNHNEALNISYDIISAYISDLYIDSSCSFNRGNDPECIQTFTNSLVNNMVVLLLSFVETAGKLIVKL